MSFISNYYIDIVIILFLIFTLILGIINGFFTELKSLIKILVPHVLASIILPILLSTLNSNEGYVNLRLKVFSFLKIEEGQTKFEIYFYFFIIFLLSFIITSILLSVFKGGKAIIKKENKFFSALSKILGAALSVFKGYLYLVIIIFVISTFSNVNQNSFSLKLIDKLDNDYVLLSKIDNYQNTIPNISEKTKEIVDVISLKNEKENSSFEKVKNEMSFINDNILYVDLFINKKKIAIESFFNNLHSFPNIKNDIKSCINT